MQLVVLCAFLLPCVNVSLAEMNGELLETTALEEGFTQVFCVNCSNPADVGSSV